jgi:6-phosphogluconolactonase
MNPPVVVSDTPEGAAARAADHIIETLGEALRERPHATLAVSGGSTPKLMFKEMARQPFDWTRVHLFWVDERVVPPDHPDSNYGMTRQALIEPLGLAEKQVHRMKGERTPQDAVAAYETELTRFFDLAPGRLPEFDVVHLGMGADGHTASLFPGDALIGDRAGIAAAAFNAERDSYRVTLLPGVLLNARDTVFLATGGDKAETLEGVLRGADDALKWPAQLASRQGKKVAWFVDRAAYTAGKGGESKQG